MTNNRSFLSVLTALIVILVAGIVTVSVHHDGSAATAQVDARSPFRHLVATSPSPSASASTKATHAATPSPTSQHSTAHVSTATTSPAVTAPNRTCGVGAGEATVSGRKIIVDLPTHFPAPVIFDYHGGGQSADQERSYTGLAGAGSRTGFIVVTPEGTHGLWNFTGAEAGLPDDVQFTQTVAALLAFAGCSNGSLYTAGISDGADMAIFASCRIPEVKAVFAVAPSITPRGTCERKSMFEVHGTADPVVPYQGSAPGSFGDTPSEGVAFRLPFWTRGCGNPVTSSPPAADTTLQVWSCTSGRRVELATVEVGGHTWPGAIGKEPAANLGAKAPWSADGLAVGFFGQH